MAENHHINYVEFPAVDLKATRAFFESAFGWQFQDWGEEYISFDNAGLEGGFYHADKSSAYENGAALVVLYAENLERAYDKVLESQGKIMKEIFSFPGGRRFHFQEPSGNELAIWSDK